MPQYPMCSEREASRTRPPARAEKRTAARSYQLKSGHAITSVYLESTDNRPDDHCWWYDSENISGTQQTRDHLFEHCSRWKDQQAELWARVKEAAKRAKRKWRVGDRLADTWDERLPRWRRLGIARTRGTERWGRVRRRRGGKGACGVVTRGPGFLCYFVFTVLFMLLLSGGRGDKGARPSGRDGRQETEKIVCRHSFVRPNASMMKPKKNTSKPVDAYLASSGSLYTGLLISSHFSHNPLTAP